MTKSQKKALARRFIFSDWEHLCGKVEFLDALEQKSPEECEVIALRLLAELHPVLP